jgi:hypothetical protein
VQAAYYREVALPIDKPAPTTKKHIAVFNNSEINNGSDADSDEEAGDGKNKNNNSARRAKRNTLKDLAKNENQTRRPEDVVPNAAPGKQGNTTGGQPQANEKKGNETSKNLSQDRPFVKIHTNHSGEKTVIEVEIATPRVILSVFLLLYVPLILLWVAYANDGLREIHYYILLPATFCATGVGFDLVNQSLAILMQAPMAISSVQGLAMFLILVLWTCIQQCRVQVLSKFSGDSWKAIAVWIIAGLGFAGYQMINHILFNHSSLSERLVFGSICPALGTLAERMVLPARMHGKSSLNSKMAQCLMTLGAVVFSIQYNSFSLVGMKAASVFVVSFVPLRLLQRYLITDCEEVPAYFLGAIDALCLMLPAGWLSTRRTRPLQTLWVGWLSESSVVLMIVLSVFTFVACHVTTLMLLRANSVTAVLVFQNLQNFVTVGLGIFCFGDHVLASPLALIGLLICLASGSWYALEIDGSNDRSSSKSSLRGQRQS